MHEGRLLVGPGKLRLSKAVGHALLNTVYQLSLSVEAVAESIIDSVDLTLDVSEVAGQDVAVHRRALSAPVTAEAAVTPAKQQGKDHDDPEPVPISEHPAGVVSALAYAYRVAAGKIIIRHSVIAPYLIFAARAARSRGCFMI